MAGTQSMAEGKPGGLLMRFAVPMMIGNGFQMLYTIAESAVVGRLIGIDAFAAMGSAGFYSWMVVSTVIGITQGFGVVLAQRFGAEDIPGLRRAFAMSVWLSVILGIFLAVVSVGMTRAVFTWINTPVEIIDKTVVYLRFLLGGCVVTFLYNLLCAALRALGNSKTPLYAMILVAVLSVVLDVLLVKVIPLGVAGVAIALITAQLCGCGLCLWSIRGLRELRLAPKDWRLDAATVRELLRMGIPMGIRNGIVMAGGIVTQSIINGYGMVYVAGISAAKRMYSLLELLATPIESATATFVAQNYGAGRMERIGDGMRTARRIMLVCCVGTAIIAFLFGGQIMALLITGDAAQIDAILAVGENQLLLMVLGLPTLYMLFLYRAALQGLGNSALPMMGGVIEMLLRVSVMMFAPLVMKEWGVFLSEIAGWPLAALFFYVAYRINFKRKQERCI